MKQHFRNFLFSVLTVCTAFVYAGETSALPVQAAFHSTTLSPAVGGAFLLYAGKFGGDVNKKEIAEQRELAVDGCAKGSKIFKYTLVVTKGGQSFTYQASSNTLTTEMQTKLKSLSAGDSFEFSQIKAYLPNGKDVVDVHAKKFFVV
jgi:hypothetical protein